MKDALKNFIKDIEDRIDLISEDRAQKTKIRAILERADFDNHPRREVQRLKGLLDEAGVFYENTRLQASLVLQDGSPYSLGAYESEEAAISAANRKLQEIRKEHVLSTVFFGDSEIEIQSKVTPYSKLLDAATEDPSRYAYNSALHNFLERLSDAFYDHCEKYNAEFTDKNLRREFMETELGCYDIEELEEMASLIR